MMQAARDKPDFGLAVLPWDRSSTRSASFPYSPAMLSIERLVAGSDICSASARIPSPCRANAPGSFTLATSLPSAYQSPIPTIHETEGASLTRSITMPLAVCSLPNRPAPLNGVA
jgi:hypothetical protein